jgi:hypothetical protein
VRSVTHLRYNVGGNTMKRMAHPAVAMHHVPAIFPASGHSLIDFVLSSGHETSSSMIWTLMM